MDLSREHKPPFGPVIVNWEVILSKHGYLGGWPSGDQTSNPLNRGTDNHVFEHHFNI